MSSYLAPLIPLLEDNQVTSIMVNNKDNIYVEINGERIKTEVRFETEADLIEGMNDILKQMGRSLSADTPAAHVRLSDGTLAHMLIPPLTLTGATMVLAKPVRNRLTWQDLRTLNAVEPRAIDFLRACVEARLNVVVAGGTGSGKVTILNALVDLIPTSERIVIIESSDDLMIKHPHAIRMEMPPASSEALATYLHHAIQMRADRIVLTSVDGMNILPILDAMRTGHDGSMFSIHATGPQDALERIEYFVLRSGLPIPVMNLRQAIAASIDVIVHQVRLPNGQRTILSITELSGMEEDAITLQPVMQQSDNGETVWSKKPYCLNRIKPYLRDSFFGD